VFDVKALLEVSTHSSAKLNLLEPANKKKSLCREIGGIPHAKGQFSLSYPIFFLHFYSNN
jgi:hypothetical protein